MKDHTCPLCGSAISVPIMFRGHRIQQVFAYIWENPNCTSTEINQVLHRSDCSLSTTIALIKRIERSLTGTPYQLLPSKLPPGPSYNGHRRPYYRFKIILRPKPSATTTEGTPNVTI